MDLWNPLPQFEAAFHRRNLPYIHQRPSISSNSDEPSTSTTSSAPVPSIHVVPLPQSLLESLPLSYHNHILLGSNLWYLQKPLRPKDVGKNRLVLVQGTRNGRLSGLRLTLESEIKGGWMASVNTIPSQYDTYFSMYGGLSKEASSSSATTAIDGEQDPISDKEGYYSIEVTGLNHVSRSYEKWQIVTQSKDVYQQWMEALNRGKLQSDVVEVSGEKEKLIDLCKKMKESLVVRKHYSRFRFYERTFVGIRSVKWLMSEKKCTMIQALAIGNRMLNVGLIFHVNNEHLLYPRNLLYQFSEDIFPTGTTNNSSAAATGTGDSVPPPKTTRLHKASSMIRSVTKGRSSRRAAKEAAAKDAAGNPVTTTGIAINGPTESGQTISMSAVQDIIDENHRLLAVHHSHQHDLTLCKDIIRTNSDQIEILTSDSFEPFKQLAIQFREYRLQKCQLLQYLLLMVIVFWLCYGCEFMYTTGGSNNTCLNDTTGTCVPSNSQGLTYFVILMSIVGKLMFFAVIVLICYVLYSDHSQEDDQVCREEELIQLVLSQNKCLSILKENQNKINNNLLVHTSETSVPFATSSTGDKVRKKSPKKTKEGSVTVEGGASVTASPSGVPRPVRRRSISSEHATSGGEGGGGGLTSGGEDDDVVMEDDDSMSDDDDDAEDLEEEQEVDEEEEDEALVVAAAIASEGMGRANNGDVDDYTLDRSVSEELGNFENGIDISNRNSDTISELSIDTYTIPNHSKKNFLKSPTRKVLAHHNQPELWPNFPILVKRSESMLPHNMTYEKGKHLLQPLRIHKPGPPELSIIDIDTDFFTGKAYLVFDNLCDTDKNVFKGKKRLFQSVVQGKFKVRVPFSKVYTGQAYDEPIHQLPFQWLVKGVGQLQPGFKSFMTGDKPYFLSPLIATSQHVVISTPGTEPKITSLNFKDDLHLLGSEFQDMSEKKRKLHFSKRRNLIGHYFEKDLVYTFDFYQDLLNFATFQLELTFIKYDIVKILGTCPVQVMAVLWDPIENNGVPPDTWRFLYNLEIYHHRSIPTDLLVTSASSPYHSTNPLSINNDTSGNTYTNPKAIPTPSNIAGSGTSTAAPTGMTKSASSSYVSALFGSSSSAPSTTTTGGAVEETGLDSIYSAPHGQNEGMVSMANPLSAAESKEHHHEDKKGHTKHKTSSHAIDAPTGSPSTGNQKLPSLASPGSSVTGTVKADGANSPPQKRKSWIGRMTSSSHSNAN